VWHIKVGLLVSPIHPFESCRTMVTVAEEAKVDSVWVPDHFVGLAHPALWPEMALAALSPDTDAWYDPFACTAIMGHESNLPMGVCVTDAVRRRAPDVVRSALTLHQLCRGGFTLGVGAGEAGHLVTTSTSIDPDIPHHNDAAVKMASPIRYTFFGPN
jgi:phthiodiolone/phenolphthiodiolone dimycocerosates ketoreductase